jgi:drug/metabolite transporter (DMT)-like permease
MLLRLEPLFVVLWAFILQQEKPGTKKLLFLALLVIGSAIVVAPDSRSVSSLKGSALNSGDAMIVASLCFISYSLPADARNSVENKSGSSQYFWLRPLMATFV